MQSSHNEGASHPVDLHSNLPAGLLESSDGVIDAKSFWEMEIPGWTTPTGKSYFAAFGEVKEMTIEGSTYRYSLFYLPEFFLSHLAYLLVLQGMPLKTLFSGALRSVNSGVPVGKISGPWLFLRGTLSPPWSIPKLENVWLARLLTPVEKGHEIRLMGELLKEVLSVD